MAVNGRRYDWESISILTPKGKMVDVQSIDYSDKRDVELVHGSKGGEPRGYGRGNYEAEGKMTLLKEEWEELKLVLAVTGGGKLYKHQPFPIVVNYANDDQLPTVDTIKGVLVTEVSESHKQNDKSSEVEVSFKAMGINRGGVEPI